MKKSRVPSILSFSLILCFYGSKVQMKRLLFSMCKGGGKFFMEKVKNGHFFKATLFDSNLINVNREIVEKFLQAREKSKLTASAIFRNIVLSVEKQSEVEMINFRRIVCDHFRAHNHQPIKFHHVNFDLLEPRLSALN